MVKSERAEHFIKCNDLDEKVKVLQELKNEDELLEFERDVKIAQGSANDQALIISFKEGGFMNQSLKRSGSEVYWYRSQDFECGQTETRPTARIVSSEADYWNQVINSNVDAAPQVTEVEEDKPETESYWDAMVNYAY